MVDSGCNRTEAGLLTNPLETPRAKEKADWKLLWLAMLPYRVRNRQTELLSSFPQWLRSYESKISPPKRPFSSSVIWLRPASLDTNSYVLFGQRKTDRGQNLLLPCRSKLPPCLGYF